ncbi:hypothetical protein MMC07_000297 [Pseudocyphellaria aurata]|nr:hypothetical protein [Pseudocyphellaria aurata]
MSSIPPLVLDVTLHDLYTSEGGGEDITLAYAIPSAEVQMTTAIPRANKFIYQSPACPTNDSDTLAREFLQMIPQHCGFLAGNMPLIMIDLDPDPDAGESSHVRNAENRRPHQADAHRLLDGLTPHQRAELTFVSKPSDIKLKQDHRLAILNPMDCFLLLPHLVDPEAHYEALSKRGLAFSGLPSPDTEIVDTILGPNQISDNELVDAEVQRMISRIRACKIPFVIKMPQSLAGQGTFVVRTDADYTNAIRIVELETRRMLRQLSPQNSHMSPCCLVLQTIVPGDAVALSFFVTKSGRAVFNACCTQLIDAEGNWVGGFCDYREQDMLQMLYDHTVGLIAAYVHKLGYWGPMGADIMTDADNKQMVIDLNVRMTGTHPLGALKSHFQKRGLNVVVLLFSLMLTLTRDEFGKEFEEELRLGSIVVNAWVHMRGGKTSMTILILAAEEKDQLDAFVKRLNVFKLPEH